MNRRQQNIFAIGLVVSVLLAGLVALAIWELGYECVRWSTRINVHDTGGVTYTRVCAEYQPRWPRDE